jgi:hypothetical protein
MLMQAFFRLRDKAHTEPERTIDWLVAMRTTRGNGPGD